MRILTIFCLTLLYLHNVHGECIELNKIKWTSPIDLYEDIYVCLIINAKSLSTNITSFALVTAIDTKKAPVHIYVSPRANLDVSTSRILITQENTGLFIISNEESYFFLVFATPEYKTIGARCSFMLLTYGSEMIRPAGNGSIRFSKILLEADEKLTIGFEITEGLFDYRLSYINSSCNSQVSMNDYEHFTKNSIQLLNYKVNSTEIEKKYVELILELPENRSNMICLNLIAFNEHTKAHTIYLARTLYKVLFPHSNEVANISMPFNLSFTKNFIVFSAFIGLICVSIVIHRIWYAMHKKHKEDIIKKKRDMVLGISNQDK